METPIPGTQVPLYFRVAAEVAYGHYDTAKALLRQEAEEANLPGFVRNYSTALIQQAAWMSYAKESRGVQEAANEGITEWHQALWEQFKAAKATVPLDYSKDTPATYAVRQNAWDFVGSIELATYTATPERQLFTAIKSRVVEYFRRDAEDTQHRGPTGTPTRVSFGPHNVADRPQPIKIPQLAAAWMEALGRMENPGVPVREALQSLAVYEIAQAFAVAGQINKAVDYLAGKSNETSFPEPLRGMCLAQSAALSYQNAKEVGDQRGTPVTGTEVVGKYARAIPPLSKGFGESTYAQWRDKTLPEHFAAVEKQFADVARKVAVLRQGLPMKPEESQALFEREGLI